MYDSMPKEMLTAKKQGLHGSLAQVLERLECHHARLKSLDSRMTPPMPEPGAGAKQERMPVSLVDMPLILNTLLDQCEKLTYQLDEKLF